MTASPEVLIVEQRARLVAVVDAAGRQNLRKFCPLVHNFLQVVPRLLTAVHSVEDFLQEDRGF